MCGPFQLHRPAEEGMLACVAEAGPHLLGGLEVRGCRLALGVALHQLIGFQRRGFAIEHKPVGAQQGGRVAGCMLVWPPPPGQIAKICISSQVKGSMVSGKDSEPCQCSKQRQASLAGKGGQT